MSFTYSAQIEQRVDELIKRLHLLEDENLRLQQQALSWPQEREQLIQKNQLAKDKAEQILARLKALEGNTHEQ